MSKETETKETSRPVLQRSPPIWSMTRQELCETLPYYRTYHSGCYFTSAPRPAWFDTHKPTAQGAPSSVPDGSTSTPAVALHRDITPYAYLLGGFGAPRDLWHAEGRVVISHGGGKSGRPDSSSGTEVEGDGKEEKSSVSSGKKRKRNGKPQARLKLLSDQSSSDARVAALLNSMRDKTPVVLILGKDYPLAHFRLREDISFAVLGWYYITDGWGERADGEGEEGDQGEAAVRWKFRFE